MINVIGSVKSLLKLNCWRNTLRKFLNTS